MIDPRAIANYRGLLSVLTSREINARYRGSVLGYLWSLVNPLLLLAVYTFVFSTVFRPRFEGASPYPLFLTTGLFSWIWMSSSMLEGAASLINNAGLIRKSVFPVELLPFVPVLSNLVNFLFSLPVIAVGLVVSRLLGYPVGGLGVVALPLILLIQLPFVSGLALALSALTVHFKDVRDIVQNLLTLLFFLTPIIYTLESVPFQWLRWFVRANPFSPFILALQQSLFRGTVPDAALWAQMLAAALISWLIGSWVFSRLSETLAEAV